jgi:hypothetical protein
MSDEDSSEEEYIEEEEDELIDEDEDIEDENICLLSDDNKTINVSDKENYTFNVSRITSDHISKFELSAVLSTRVGQIAKNNIHFSDLKDEPDPYVLAVTEIKLKRCPLIIIRYIGVIDGKKMYEKWSVNELVINL